MQHKARSMLVKKIVQHHATHYTNSKDVQNFRTDRKYLSWYVKNNLSSLHGNLKYKEA